MAEVSLGSFRHWTAICLDHYALFYAWHIPIRVHPRKLREIAFRSRVNRQFGASAQCCWLNREVESENSNEYISATNSAPDCAGFKCCGADRSGRLRRSDSRGMGSQQYDADWIQRLGRERGVQDGD